MTMKSLFRVSMTCVLLILSSVSSVAANCCLFVTFNSTPMGATVLIDGEIAGVTPLTIEIDKEIHPIELELPGFTSHEQEYRFVEDTTHYFTLAPGPDLIEIPLFLQGRWIDGALYLWNGNSLFSVFDADSEETIETADVPGWFTGEEIAELTGIEQSAGFSSPSGRYIVFVEDELWHISDTVRQERIAIYIHALDASMIHPTSRFRFVWDHDESWLLVNRATSQQCDVLINLRTFNDAIQCFYAIDDAGDTVFFDDFVGLPNSDGFVLARNDHTNSTPATIWLLDLAMGSARSLPPSEIYGAVLLPDSSSLLIAHSDGISLYNVDTLNESELVSDVPTAQWGVHRVIFSPSGEFALIYATYDDVFDYTYLYHNSH